MTAGRLQPTELFPEMATLDCGTCNFGDDVFTNDMPTMRAFGKRMMENHIKPGGMSASRSATWTPW